MIVRILGEGQLEVGEEHLDRLNELDAALDAAVRAEQQDAFQPALAALLDGVRAVGTPIPPDALDSSDFILPPADATLDEVRDLLSDEGLIPG